MRCQNCGQDIIAIGEGFWVHYPSGHRGCLEAPVATPPPEDQPNVTPVDGR